MVRIRFAGRISPGGVANRGVVCLRFAKLAQAAPAFAAVLMAHPFEALPRAGRSRPPGPRQQSSRNHLESGVRPMFSRKRSETEDRKMADASDDLGIPMKPARPAGPSAAAPIRPPAMPPRTPDLARAGDPARSGDWRGRAILPDPAIPTVPATGCAGPSI